MLQTYSTMLLVMTSLAVLSESKFFSKEPLALKLPATAFMLKNINYKNHIDFNYFNLITYHFFDNSPTLSDVNRIFWFH